MSAKMLVTTVTVFDDKYRKPASAVAVHTDTVVVEFETDKQAFDAAASINSRAYVNSPSEYAKVSMSARVL